MTEILQLKLLGHPEINLAGVAITEALSAKAQAILYYLAVTGQPQSRSFLASLLWGEMLDADARTNLRKALANLRRVLGDYLDLDRNEIAFKPRCAYWVDVGEFVAGVTEPGGETLRLQEAVALYRGDFLADFYVREALEFENWALAEQTRFRELVIQALHTLAAQQAEQGELVQAIGVLRRLLGLESWREEAHRQLMLLLARHGQRSAALAQFESCRLALAEELGVEPGPETAALYEQIKAGKIAQRRSESPKGEAAPFPAPTAAALHQALPAQPTAFVGREPELADIIRRLMDKDCRLLTLVGPGGIGKTRLALQTAQILLDSKAVEDFFAHGILFVPLAAVSAAGGLAPAIARAAGFNFSGNLPPKQQLLGYLQRKKILLILDNLEHLLSPPAGDSLQEDGAAELIAEILGVAPGAKILVTSREALNLQEAWFHPVEGLSFPANSLPPAKEGAEAKLEMYDAVRLFVQGAQRARVQFSLTQEQAHVVRICQLVEGMPLALELATTWLKVMPTEKITRQIEQSLDILTSRLQDIPERHRSMRVVFEHSWHLLSPEEQTLLQQLSIFRGSFAREAAEKVAGASLMLLATLVEKSLVRVTELDRYQMHELLRQFAAEKLAQSPEAQALLQNRHCAYYAGWLEQQDTRLRTERQLEAAQEISANLENIQVAWRWAVEQGEATLLSRFFWSLWFVYEAKSWFHAGVELFGGAAARLKKFEQAADPEQRRVYARLLAFEGRFWLRLHRLEQSEPNMRRSLPLLQALEAERDLGLAYQTLGLTAWVQGRYLEARDYFEQSVASADQGGDPLIAAYARAMSGFVAYGLGEYRLAEQLIEERLPVLRQIGKLWGLVFSLAYLSNILSALGKAKEAEGVLREGLAISREMGDRWAVADCLRRLGSLLTAGAEAEGEAAKPLLVEGIAIFREIDDPWGLTTTLNQLGQTCGVLGDYGASRQHLTEALQLAHQSRLTPIVLDILVSLAELGLQAKALQPAGKERQIESLDLLALVINHPAGEQATKERARRLLGEPESERAADKIAPALSGSSHTLEVRVAELLTEKARQE